MSNLRAATSRSGDIAAVRDAYETVFTALMTVRHFDLSAEAKSAVRAATAGYVAAVEHAMVGYDDPSAGESADATVIDMRAVFAARGKKAKRCRSAKR